MKKDGGRFRALAGACVLGLVASLVIVAGATAAPPQERQQPTIEGTPDEGRTLTATNGEWTNSPTSYSYRWLRCNDEARNCNTISGATSKTYTVDDDDVGKRLVVHVTATNADGSSTANSTPTRVVSSKDEPKMQKRPSISGKPIVGEELMADPGEWTGFPTFTYQWQKCDSSGNNCSNISGATSRSYGVRTSDAGNTLRVQVRARTGGGTQNATSDRTAVVTAGTQPAPPAPPVGVGGALSVSAVSLPNRLVISQVQFSPRAIPNRNTPLVARFKVSETQGNRPVAGALVYAIGVPSNRISPGSEVATDSTGWATITYRVLPGMPIQRGSRLTIFVRARKPGDSLLAGVSSRRLVSVGVIPG